jgi:hypothetical protein
MLGIHKNAERAQDEFFLNLLDFYKKFLQRTSDTVSDLHMLQRDYKKYYDEFVEFQKNPPEYIMELTKNINSEAGTIVFFLLARIAILQSKMSHVFELNADEQKKLSEELTGFIKEFDDKIAQLKKIQEATK